MPDIFAEALDMLTRSYPEAAVTAAVQPLSVEDLAAQKHKHAKAVRAHDFAEESNAPA